MAPRKLFVAFRTDKRGSITIIFALAVVMILTAVGAGLDLSRAYQTRQKLAEVTMLGCQYATRPAILEPVAASNSRSLQQTDYVSTVTSFINTSLGKQHLAVAQTNGTPFTYTSGGAAQVTLTAAMPTVFMQIMHVNTIPLSVTANCFSTISQVTSNTSPYLVQEGFETTGADDAWYLPNGTVLGYEKGTAIAKTTTFNTANVYVGSAGAKWVVMGYCVEVDKVGTINATAPQGSHTAELDCDNGYGTGVTRRFRQRSI